MSMIDDLVERATALETEGRDSEAIELWREASELEQRPRIMASLGRLYAFAGDFERGESLLLDTIANHPSDPDAYYFLGFVYRRMSRLEEAKQRLQEGLAFEEWAPAYAVLGDICRRLEEPNEARVSFTRAIGLDAKNSEAWYGLGRVTDDPAEAADAFRQATMADPENWEAHRDLGQLYWRSREFTEAERSIRRALELNPEDPWAHYSLGKTLSMLGCDSEAESELCVAIDLRSDLPLFHCGLGEVLAKQGRHDQAESAYKAALALNVSDYLANLRYGEFLQNRGFPRRAMHYARRALAAAPGDHRIHELIQSLEKVGDSDT